MIVLVLMMSYSESEWSYKDKPSMQEPVQISRMDVLIHNGTRLEILKRI